MVKKKTGVKSKTLEDKVERARSDNVRLQRLMEERGLSVDVESERIVTENQLRAMAYNLVCEYKKTRESRRWAEWSDNWYEGLGKYVKNYFNAYLEQRNNR
jgi:hypothetical protein